MGCGTSTNQVHVIDDTLPGKHVSSNNNRRKIADLDTCSIKSQERGGSATSKISRHSGDSGFNDEDEIRNNMHRDSSLLNRPQLSAKGERIEEKQLLATLHEEGLIQRPIGRGAFGFSFEVMSELSGSPRRPPPRLAKLEHKKKKKRVLTEEEIKEKLEKAEQRRKEQEQQRLDKIHSLHKIGAGDLPAFVSPEIDEAPKTKDEIAAENREKKLREKLEKLKARKEHADAVRQRKLMAQAASLELQDDDSTNATINNLNEME